MIKKNICILLLFFSISITQAQLSFCTGNSGDPIFEEDFGTGTGFGSLPIGVTSYNNANGRPSDGSYAISSSSNAWFDWHNISDHTEGDVNGRMLIINADPNPGEFYVTQISGLCENTTYEFSSWMINLLPSSHRCNPQVPINVRFEIWDNTDTNLLAAGDTGSIGSTATPNWEQYGLVFQTEPGQTAVILKMRNNGAGGCGNDLAIDDIVFKTCGDLVTIEDASSNVSTVYVCQDDLPFSTTLTATPDFTVFSSHFYQWQESTDSTNWVDISGATNNEYIISSINNTMFYRVLVAEDVINLSNSSCNSSSEIFEVSVTTFPDVPVVSDNNLMLCEGDTTPLSVTVPNGVTVNWYDAPVAGNLLQANSLSYSPGQSGTYYAEAETINGNCLSLSRIPLEINYYELPGVEDEVIEFCENTNITLHADTNILTATYVWNTGEISEAIIVDTPGIYYVDVTNMSCTVRKTIEVNQIDNPVVDSSGIISDGNDIVVTTSNTGDFLYSLDGNIFSPNNTFYDVEGGLYTISVIEQNCSEIITIDYIHFYIPKFFTPNGDGENDEFDLRGIELFANSQVSIFDRYGKLLKNSRNMPFSWNGSYAGNMLPADDYWYVVVIDGQKMTGHFTLKR